MPVLPPRSSEFVAVNVAPPVKIMPCIDAHAMVGAPLATDKVAVAELLLVKKYIGLLEVPTQLNAFETVTVAELVRTTPTGPVTFIVAMVGAPPIDQGTCAELAEKLTVLYVKPPLWNSLRPPFTTELPEKEIVELLAVNVRFVVVPKSHAVPLLIVSVYVPFPILKFRVPVPVPLIFDAITFGLFTEKSRIQPVVEAVHAPNVRDVNDSVTAPPVMVQVVPPTQVLASIVTVSPATGCVVLFEPPDEVDHIASLVLSHAHEVEHNTRNFAAALAGTSPTTSSAKARTRLRRIVIARLTYRPR